LIALLEAFDQLGDGLRLVACGFVGGMKFKFWHMKILSFTELLRLL
jgi:hypothetical protein